MARASHESSASYGVVGAGLMGSGIAATMCAAGRCRWRTGAGEAAIRGMRRPEQYPPQNAVSPSAVFNVVTKTINGSRRGPIRSRRARYN